MEEIKSTPVYMNYTDLHREFTYEERCQYLPAVFDDKELLSHESLCNIFDGNCLTQDVDGDGNALGFIAGIPTRAVAEYDKLKIIALTPPLAPKDFEEWKDTIMNNFFGFEPGDVKLDTTIYDSAGFFVWCFSIFTDMIVLNFFRNQKYGE